MRRLLLVVLLALPCFLLKAQTTDTLYVNQIKVVTDSSRTMDVTIDATYTHLADFPVKLVFNRQGVTEDGLIVVVNSSLGLLYNYEDASGSYYCYDANLQKTNETVVLYVKIASGELDSFAIKRKDNSLIIFFLAKRPSL